MTGDGSAWVASKRTREKTVLSFPVYRRSYEMGSYQMAVCSMCGSQPSSGSRIREQYGCQVVSQLSSISPSDASRCRVCAMLRDQRMR